MENSDRCPDCPWCDPATTGPAVLNLFASAPKMTAIHLPGIRVSRASDRSRNPGGLWIGQDDEEGGCGELYGSIRSDGEFRIRANFPAAAREIFKRLAAFGAEELARIGRTTGRCCYCGRTLTDPVSVELGYGPVCAKYHHLPHGKDALRKAA